MTTYAIPENSFLQTSFGLQANTQSFTSPLSNNTQVLELAASLDRHI